jgi:hypothetical protein
MKLYQIVNEIKTSIEKDGASCDSIELTNETKYGDYVLWSFTTQTAYFTTTNKSKAQMILKLLKK